MRLIRSLSYLVAFAAVTFILPLSGCASTKVLTTAAEPSGDQALVYFVRYKYPPYIHELQISADKKPVATLANSDYVSVNLPIGEHIVDLTIMDGRPLSFKLPIERSERIYVMLSGDVTRANCSQAMTNPLYLTICNDWSLYAYRISQAEAERALGRPVK